MYDFVVEVFFGLFFCNVDLDGNLVILVMLVVDMFVVLMMLVGIVMVLLCRE